MLVLPQGRYFIIAKYKDGDAQASMEVAITADESRDVNLVMNVGYSQMHAVPKQGVAPSTEDLYWEVYEPEKDLHGNRKRIAFSRNETPLFKLSAGRYRVTVKHGDAVATMDMEVTAGEHRDVNLVMNVGYAQMYAIPKQGMAPITEDLYWEVYKDEKDLHGNRKRIAFSRSETPLFTLLEGRYHVTVKYGKITASKEMALNAGGRQDITMDLSFAK